MAEGRGIQASARPADGLLFEHVVTRVGGLPAGSLEGLRAAESAAALDEVWRLEGELAAVGEELTDALYQAIGGLEDRQLRRRLLGLRRQVHKLEAIEVPEGLDGALTAGLERYAALSERRRQAGADFVAAFERELPAARRCLQELVADEDFQKGLLLSSRTLAAALPRYRRADAASPGAKLRQVERSLLRYVSRMAMKATPFSTFCNVVPGRLVDSLGESARLRGDPRAKHSRLRLNKALYVQLLPFLLRRPAVRGRLGVEVNPTLREESGQLCFLTAQGGREVFQRLDPHPVVERLRGVLGRGPRTLGELVSILCEDAEIEASREEAEVFLDRLLEIGLLRLRVGIAEQEVDWDLPLGRLLATAAQEDGQLTATVRGLERLRGVLAEYAAADLPARRRLLDEAAGEARRLAEALGAPAPPKQQPPFYEDAGSEDAGGSVCLELDPGALEDVLDEYVTLTRRIAWPRGEQANMRHFFESYYPAGRPVPLLRFYEDYHREHFKGHLERQQGRQAAPAEEAEEASEETPYDLGNPFGLDLIARIQEAHRRLAERVTERWRQAPEVEVLDLDRGDLEAVFAGLAPPREPCLSVSLFAHLLPGEAPGGGLALVANSYLQGYGKYFSRFLYLLPEEVEADLLAANRRLAAGEEANALCLAEICGDAGHNANLHPPLVPWELSYPTGESGASERQIASADLLVEVDPRDPHRLRLRRQVGPGHGEGGPEVVPVDLGFLNPRMRPPLFQLLSRFSPAANFGLQFPESPQEPFQEPTPREMAPQASPAAFHRPRITYRGHLVLARRRWRVGDADFPHRRGGEAEHEYFRRVDHWRRRLGLPAEVFLRVQPLPSSKAGKPRRLRQHLHKPQFLDFASPLLVDLFSRVGESLDRFELTFEERLPARRHLVTAGGDSWATEVVLQLDRPPGRPPDG